MNPRNTLILLAIALGLGAFVYFYEIRGEEAREEAERGEKLVFQHLAAADVRWIALTTSDGRQARVERSDGGWRVVEPVDFPGDAVAIDGMTSALADLASEGVISEPQAPSVYGLGEEARVIRFGAGDADELVLRQGRKTPVGSNSYVARGDDPRVFMVPTWRLNSLQKSLRDLRDRRLLDFDTAAVDRLEARWPGGHVVLEKREGDWQLLEPVTGRADPDTVSDLLSELAFLRAEDFEDVEVPDAEAGLDDPEWAVELRVVDDAGETRELSLAIGTLRDGDHRLVRAMQPSLYRIRPERLDDLPRDVIDYRFKTLARFDTSQVRRFELEFHGADGEEGLVEGVYADGGWTTRPEAMAEDKPGKLVRELARLKGVAIVAADPADADLPALGLSPPRAAFRIYGVPAPGGDDEVAEPVEVLLADVRLGEIEPGSGIAAQAGEGGAVYRVDGDLAEHLPVSLEALRNRFLAQEEAAAADAGSELPPE